MDSQPLARWEEELKGILNKKETLAPGELIRTLSELGGRMGTDAAESLLRYAPGLLDHAPAVTAAYYRYILDHELVEIGRLFARAPSAGLSLAKDGDELTQSAYDRVRELFERVDFGGCRRFVMVGCGRIPSTMLHVQDRTGVPEIIGLDVITESVETVARLARHFGWSRITSQHIDGAHYDYSDAQIVYVANMVTAKSAVLRQIAETAPAGVQIVMREPYSLGRLWAECAEDTLDPRLQVVAHGFGVSAYFSRDVFVRRREDRHVYAS